MFAASLGYWKASPNVDPATGGIISIIDVNGIPYQVHTFTAPGSPYTFSTSTSLLNCEVLMVAPGGSATAGGFSGSQVYVGGGGGGGAVYPVNLVTNVSTNYTIVVGNGTVNSGGITQALGFTVYGGGSGGTLGPGSVVTPVGPYGFSGVGGGSGGGGGVRSNISFTSTQIQSGGTTSQISTYGYGLANIGGSGTLSNPVITGGRGGGAGNSGAGYVSNINGNTVEYGVGGTGQSYNFSTGITTAGARADGPGAGGGSGGAGSTSNGRDGIVIIRYPLIV